MTVTGSNFTPGDPLHVELVAGDDWNAGKLMAETDTTASLQLNLPLGNGQYVQVPGGTFTVTLTPSPNSPILCQEVFQVIVRVVDTLTGASASATAREDFFWSSTAPKYDPAQCRIVTSLTSSLNPSVYGQSVTFTTTGTDLAGVTFSDGGTPLGSIVSNAAGVGSFSTSALSAGTHTITASYGDAASRSAPVTQVVSPAPLTITANDQRMTVGDPVPAFDAGYSGFVNGEDSSVVSGLTCGVRDSQGNPVDSNTPAGTYPITCSGASADNYSMTYQPGTLTIQPAQP
jgi:hypothetical protein